MANKKKPSGGASLEHLMLTIRITLEAMRFGEPTERLIPALLSSAAGGARWRLLTKKQFVAMAVEAYEAAWPTQRAFRALEMSSRKPKASTTRKAHRGR